MGFSGKYGKKAEKLPDASEALLLEAARSGEVAAARAALDAGADKNCKDPVRACTARLRHPTHV
jgi:hypothetical protein